jgi:chemotaxis-related protein WspD
VTVPTRTPACWQTIGIRGDKSCSRLPEYVHCRSCPVFASAAAECLERPVTADYREEWTRHYAEPRAASTARIESALVFRIGSEWVALPTRVFAEAAEARVPHALPYPRSSATLGIVNVRGDLIVHVSLVELLGTASAQTQARAAGGPGPRLLVLADRGRRIAFTADEVDGVYRYDPEHVRQVPSTLDRAPTAHTLGVLELGGRSLAFLDSERLLAAITIALG